MLNLLIARQDQLSVGYGLLNQPIVLWCYRDDGRVQFVERPEWHHWLTLFCYAWVVWSIFWMYQGVKPTAPVFIMSSIAGMVFVFNAILWWTGRYLVTIKAQVRGSGSYKDGRFVPDNKG